MSERKLASIITVKKVEDIPDKDRIGYISFNECGWQVIGSKEVRVGEKVLYIEYDTVILEGTLNKMEPEFACTFKKRCWSNKWNGCVIRAMKMAGKVSYGIMFRGTEVYPYLMSKEEWDRLGAGDDLTKRLGIVSKADDFTQVSKKEKVGFFRKWWSILLWKLFKIKKKKSGLGEWVPFISRTDETRIQALPNSVMEDLQGQRVYIREKIDGCLTGDADITTDHGQIPIRKIVSQQLPVRVLTYNEETKQSEFKPILQYHKYPAPVRFYKVGVGFKGKGNRAKFIKCTSNHEFFTNQGWVSAENLKAGETIYHFNRNTPNELNEIILGCLLGDSSISAIKNGNRNYRTVWFNHGVKQTDYFNYKKSLFGDMFIEEGDRVSGYGTVLKRGILKSNLSVLKLINDVCVDETGRKKVTKEWVDMLTPLSLAFWYMDGGTLCHREESNLRCKINISTQGFSYEENLLLQEGLKRKFNITAIIGDKDVYKGYCIFLNRNDTENFCSLIAPYIPKSMKYKLPKKYENFSCFLENQTFNLNDSIIETKVLSVEICDWDTYRKALGGSVWDLTVKDNSNYFANNVLVHNSSFTSAIHKGKFYICSRNQCLYNKPLKEAISELIPANASKQFDRFIATACKYDLARRMGDVKGDFFGDQDWALQGEQAGPGIQGNPCQLGGIELFVFNVFNIDTQRYLDNDYMCRVVEMLNARGDVGASPLQTVPAITLPNGKFGEDVVFLWKTVQELEELAKGKTFNGKGKYREGIVIRKKTGDGYLPDPARGMSNMYSFKVINPDFILSKKD